MANFLQRTWNFMTQWQAATPSLPLQYGWSWLSGAGTPDAGVVVSREDAMEIAAVLLTFTHITWDVSQVPLRTYRRTAGNDRVEAEHESVGRPWRSGPNAWQTRPAWIGQVMMQLQSVGDYYARTGFVGGLLDELYPIEDPTAVETRVVAGRPIHRYQGRDYAGAPGPACQMLHLHVPSFEGYRGSDFLDTHRQTLSLARALYRTGALFYSNGGNPSGILVLPATANQTQVDAAKEKFLEEWGGTNAQKVFVASAGADFKPVSMEPQKAQALETRAHVNKEIFGLSRYPAWRAYGESPSTLEGRTGYWTETIGPWLELIASAVNKFLMPADCYVEFDLDELLKADLSARYAAYASGISGMFLKRNEARRWEGLPSLGPDGDKILNPNTLTDAQMQAGQAGAGQ